MSERFVYISLGAGVQSSAVLVMSALGWYDCPKADVAIFADTQDEPQYVYDYLEHLKKFGEEHGIPVEVVTAGRLSDDKHVLIPGFVLGKDGRPSMSTRGCTQDYKIIPIRRRVRALLGFKPRQRIPARSAVALIGISRDEIQRMKPSRDAWIVHQWPLVDAGLYRGNCEEIVKRAGLPMPQKSACTFCPYHDDGFWRRLRDESPKDFEVACGYDERIRSSSSRLRLPMYLHRSLKALRDVDLSVDATPQLDFGFQNECEGHCGV